MTLGGNIISMVKIKKGNIFIAFSVWQISIALNCIMVDMLSVLINIAEIKSRF